MKFFIQPVFFETIESILVQKFQDTEGKKNIFSFIHEGRIFELIIMES